MPAPNISVPYRALVDQCARHDVVVAGLSAIDPKLQRLVAELVLIRLFDEFQDAIRGVACRLACGVPYADGAPPALLGPSAASTAGAMNLFKTHGRIKPANLRWTNAKFIKDSTKRVIDHADHFGSSLASHTTFISEMQAVRNRIAHKNTSARLAYADVVLRRYGARRNNVSPGLLLLTDRFTPPLLQTYITSCRVVVKDCTRSV